MAHVTAVTEDEGGRPVYTVQTGEGGEIVRVTTDLYGPPDRVSYPYLWVFNTAGGEDLDPSNPAHSMLIDWADSAIEDFEAEVERRVSQIMGRVRAESLAAVRREER